MFHNWRLSLASHSFDKMHKFIVAYFHFIQPRRMKINVIWHVLYDMQQMRNLKKYAYIDLLTAMKTKHFEIHSIKF